MSEKFMQNFSLSINEFGGTKDFLMVNCGAYFVGHKIVNKLTTTISTSTSKRTTTLRDRSGNW